MNLAKTLVASAVALCAFQAQALVVTPGYTATLTTGPTSLVAGVTTETFQGAPVFVRGGQWDIFNSNSPGVSLTGNGIYLKPGISAQPQKGVVSPKDKWASVGDDHTAWIKFASGTSYVGFLWGSVDTYNTVSFYDSFNTKIASFKGGNGGLGLNQVPEGNGNQATSQYFNFFSADIAKVKFQSGSNAFEIDNVSAVPEPETYALMLAGLAAVGFVARRRRPA